MKKWSWVRSLLIYLIDVLDITPGELGWRPKPHEIHIDIDIAETFPCDGKTIELVMRGRATGKIGLDAQGNVKPFPQPMKVELLRKRVDVIG